MKTLETLARKGWQINIYKNPDGFYVEIELHHMHYSGFDQHSIAGAIRDLKTQITEPVF